MASRAGVIAAKTLQRRFPKNRPWRAAPAPTFLKIFVHFLPPEPAQISTAGSRIPDTDDTLFLRLT